MEASQDSNSDALSNSPSERVTHSFGDHSSNTAYDKADNRTSENEAVVQSELQDSSKEKLCQSDRGSNEKTHVTIPQQNDIVPPFFNPTDVETNTEQALLKSEMLFSEKRVWISISVILICYIVTFISLVPICTQYFSYRIAYDKYNKSVNSSEKENKCANTSSEDEDFTNKVQREASNTILYATFASGIPAVFTCLFVGSYSDYLGRKLLLIASISGGIVRIVILSLIIELHLDIELYYAGAFVDGLLGSYYTTTLAAMAVIADITPPANRAIRFAILEGILFVSSALSQLAIGYLIEEEGYFLPVVSCGGLLFIALVTLLLFLPETVKKKNDFQWNLLVHIKHTFGFYFLEGTKISRVRYGIGLATFQTLMLTNLGRLNVETLFVLNSPICWDSMDIGIFNSIRLVVMSLVAVIVLRLCKYRISLETTGMLCGLSAMAGFIMEGFADSTAAMYLAALIGILYLAIIPIPRALLSQITSPTKQGALFSSLSCFETAVSMVSSTAYTLVYSASLDTFKGAVFMVMASLCLINVLLLVAFRWVRLRYPVSYDYLVKDRNKSVEPGQRKDYEDGLRETAPLLKDRQDQY